MKSQYEIPLIDTRNGDNNPYLKILSPPYPPNYYNCYLLVKHKGWMHLIFVKALKKYEGTFSFKTL